MLVRGLDNADIERWSRAPSPGNIGMPSRPMCVPTASWCRTASMTPSPSASPRPRAMKVAAGFEPGAVIGPLIDIKAVEKVEAHIADSVKKGAKVVTGSKRAAQGGSFFEPTVLTDVTTDMVITKEETFGPVAPLYRFKTEAEAIKMANDTEFGLAAYFYSRDIGRIWRVAEALDLRHCRH